MAALFWIIGIITFIVAIFYIPIYADIVFGSETKITIGWLFIKKMVYPTPPKTKKDKNKKTTTPKPKTDEDKNKKNKTFTSENFAEVLGIIKESLGNLKDYFKALLRAFNIRKLNVVWKISSDDACKTAVDYGKYSGLFYTVYAFVSNYVDIKPKRIDISPDFTQEKSTINGSLKINLIPAKIISSTVIFAIKTLIIFVKNKNNKKNEKVVKNYESAPNKWVNEFFNAKFASISWCKYNYRRPY